MEQNRFIPSPAPDVRRFHLSPPQTITISFAAMILVGACLLCLPFASRDGNSVGFVDALFTATSANCVTGLVVVNTLSHWTIFGKAVILVLIQLGGLGFMTVLTLSMLAMRRRISLRSRIVIQASFNQDSTGGMVRLVQRIFKTTLVFEGAGTLLLAAAFYAEGGMTLWQATYKGFFHAVSAFCNAGFDIIGSDSLVPYRDSLAVNWVIMCLILAGGLGFPVWAELLWRKGPVKRRSLRSRIHHLSLHTKIALLVTLVLVITGVLLFLLLEWGNPETLGHLPVAHKIQAAFFQSVTLRTAGFNTISQAGLTDISKLVSSLLMLIGGSPAGTAGGIKTVTLALVLVSMMSALRGRRQSEVFGRTLPLELLQKALTVVCLMFGVCFITVLVLHFTERNIPFEHDVIDLIFETASAAGTVGVSTGLTPHLTTAGRCVISLCMFLGRLSPVTVAVALNMRMRGADDGIAYPEERVIIG